MTDGEYARMCDLIETSHERYLTAEEDAEYQVLDGQWQAEQCGSEAY